MSGRHLKRAFARFFNYLLAPGLCLACGCGNDGIDLLCADCAAELRAVPNPCRHCGKPNPLETLVCPSCLLNPPRWQQLIAPLQYRGLTREYLLQLKYAEAIYLAKCLGLHCLERMRQNPLKPEALLPVPLHRERLFERGFNQAQEIAAVWARPLGIALDRNALQRSRATATQAGLSAAQRIENVRGAFEYSPKLDYRHVAIVDDIVTTGSTVAEITRVLHAAGVEYVEVWALARAYRQ